MSFKTKYIRLLFSFLLIVVIKHGASQQTRFNLLSPNSTGIFFTNTIKESDKLNILNEAYIYNGGGVGVGDFNNDGLQDIYLAGNMLSNKLYLNKGSLKFTDVTVSAGVSGMGRWCSGISVVDINLDGKLDIYVCATFLKDASKRINLLYINQGNNALGIPTFKEMAASYGLADNGYSTQGIFFDYDNDGDLDLYLVTNTLNDPKTTIQFRDKIVDGSALNTDRLYRNNGNNTFTNVSRKAGILIEGWGHAVSVSDINLDGWPDIYVSNDFISNDICYINNQDGTFTNKITTYFKHTSWYTMGTDIADINNDGYVDLVALDMLPETNVRKKGMLAGNEYYNYFNNKKFDYQHQYVRNVLQLNSGPTQNGSPIFSDVGYLAGIHQTDWSWSPLVADFDNDGFKDIIITNGLPRDVTDLDYISYDNGQKAGIENTSLKMVDALPVVKTANYVFRNLGGYTFADSTVAWGLQQPSFSNGAAYVDLDNDGDLDIIINNINQSASVYENRTNNITGNNKQHQVSIKLVGDVNNPQAIGSSIHIYYNGDQHQYYEQQPCRGYLSTNTSIAHFGLASSTIVDSVIVRWPNKKITRLLKVNADQNLIIRYEGTNLQSDRLASQKIAPVYKEVSKDLGIQYKHNEKDAVDYNIQPTLPHKLSQYGPGIAVADINNDGYDDFYLAASAGNKGVFYLQNSTGIFTKDTTRMLYEQSIGVEEMGALFFDADNDGDVDLYVVSGSYEFAPNNVGSQDRLYINDGAGHFVWDHLALPLETANGSCVRAADFDQDGDLDLFVGGRSVSGAYPTAPHSYLFRNDGGKFIDVTRQYCNELETIGMVSDALWTDFNNDGKMDLILAGEWMPITFLKNTGTSLELVIVDGNKDHIGWFNSLCSGDFDNDGDVDYVAGNLGLNSNFKATVKQPMVIMAKESSDKNKVDAMIFCYIKDEDGTKKLFPMHAKEDLTSQMISIRKQFPTFKSYGKATIDDLWSKDDKQGAIRMEANDLSSLYFENKGDGHFAISSLPISAQTAPIFGMVSTDLDNDGNLDIVMTGNDFGMEPGAGRHDAFNGLCLKGNGKGGFDAMTIEQSGFYVKGDGKALARLHIASNNDALVCTQNQDSVLVFQQVNGPKQALKWIDIKPQDSYAELFDANRKKSRIEFQYGSTFLSQSSRKLSVTNQIKEIIITDFKGNKRTVVIN